MTDKQLYKLCKKFGRKALEARRKFIGLLPEVNKRQLFEKKGFSSIYEFAAKLGGVSQEQVNIVLRLNQKFNDKPALKNALIKGEISINKLARITSIATAENQSTLLEKTKILSKNAIEVFVRDVKNFKEKAIKNETQNCLFKAKIDQETLPGHRLNSLKNTDIIDNSFNNSLQLAPDVENQLHQMQQKGIDINEFLREAFEKRDQEIDNEKNKIAEALEKEQIKRAEVGMHPKINVSRYIPAKIKIIIRKEHGSKCSIPGCTKQAKTLHHTQRFALSHNHNPKYLAPLCNEHYEIAHKIDLRVISSQLHQFPSNTPAYPSPG